MPWLASLLLLHVFPIRPSQGDAGFSLARALQLGLPNCLAAIEEVAEAAGNVRTRGRLPQPRMLKKQRALHGHLSDKLV